MSFLLALSSLSTYYHAKGDVTPCLILSASLDHYTAHLRDLPELRASDLGLEFEVKGFGITVFGAL